MCVCVWVCVCVCERERERETKKKLSKGSLLDQLYNKNINREERTSKLVYKLKLICSKIPKVKKTSITKNVVYLTDNETMKNTQKLQTQ